MAVANTLDGCYCRWVLGRGAATIALMTKQHTKTMHDSHRPSDNAPSSAPWRAAGLFAVRYGLGAAMILGGIVVLLAVGGDLGAYGLASAVGAGLSVLLLNLLYRMSVSGDRDREREEEARRYFDEHGVWPEDDEPSKRASRRRWTLPDGAVTAEQEERERGLSAVRGASPTV
jgi:hypothetical protein